MVLSWIDWLIILGFLGLSWYLSTQYHKQKLVDLNDYFLGGRNLPWYVAGISIVATTFAADTPLAVAEIVALNGISGNWPSTYTWKYKMLLDRLYLHRLLMASEENPMEKLQFLNL